VLGKFFESLYLKVIVNIVVERSRTVVYIELCSKKGVVSAHQESFETLDINSTMLEFIRSYTNESPFSYISILDSSAEQGAIPTCAKNRLSYYHDLSACEYKCFDEKWITYTSKTDLYTIEKRYKEIGMDFIFSPFSILSNFFKDKVNGALGMYIVVQDNYLSLGIFENSELLFAEHLDMEHNADRDEISLSDEITQDDIELDMDKEIDLDDVEVLDDMEDLDSFGDIEDLDSIEEIAEFSENQDIEEEFYEAEEVLAESDEAHFNEDYQRFSLIKSSVGNFYSDKKYESQFIENIYIADGIGVSPDLKHYLEEEMFLNVYIRHVDLSAELCELSKMELGL